MANNSEKASFISPTSHAFSAEQLAERQAAILFQLGKLHDRLDRIDRLFERLHLAVIRQDLKLYGRPAQKDLPILPPEESPF